MLTKRNRIDAAGEAMYQLLTWVMDDDATRDQYADEWQAIVDYIESGKQAPIGHAEVGG